MPELPEIEVVKKRLKNILCGEMVKDVKLIKPYILKTFKPNYIKLVGKKLIDIERIGKWLFFDFEEIFLYYHPRLTGNIAVKENIMRDTGFVIYFENYNLLFNEIGKEKISEIYIYQDKDEFFNMRKIGSDPLSNEFNIEYVKDKMKNERRQIYKVLIDQSVFSGIGAAYMNEILFDARLSPFKKCKELNDDEIIRLYAAILNVLKNAIKEIERIDDKIEIKEKREFTKVYRKKECPLCKGEIKQVFFSNLTIYYCPNCQTEGKIYKDRRFSLFLK